MQQLEKGKLFEQKIFDEARKATLSRTTEFIAHVESFKRLLKDQLKEKEKYKPRKLKKYLKPIRI